MHPSNLLGADTSTPGSIASASGYRPLVRGLIVATVQFASLGVLVGQRGTPLKRPGGSRQSRRKLRCALDCLAMELFRDNRRAHCAFLIHHTTPRNYP